MIVNLASLSLPQLRSLQTRLTSELEHLTSSHAKLRAAQSKFRDCVNSINDGVTGSEKKGTKGRDEILVPLTSSLYVKGRLTDREKVLVDVGTGFYVEKVCACRVWVLGSAIVNPLCRHLRRRLLSTMTRLRAWMPICRSSRRLFRIRARNCGLWRKVSVDETHGYGKLLTIRSAQAEDAQRRGCGAASWCCCGISHGIPMLNMPEGAW